MQAARRLDTAEHQIARIEGRMDAIPTQREFATLSKDIGKVAAEVAGVRAGLDGVQTMVEGLSGQVRTLTERGLST